MRLHSATGLAFYLLLVVGHASAAEVLDQQNDVTPSATADSTSGGFLEQAQTFTVGVSGTLSRIAVQINFPGFGSSGNAILTVYNTTGGLPNASLGTASLPSFIIPSTGYAFRSFDVSSYAIPVHVGDVLAYGIASSIDSYFFERSTFDHSTYVGGESLYRQVNPTGPWTAYTPSHDGGFQTYVIPSSAGLPGDYNHNGIVDAADYTVWRDSLGQVGAGLAADGDGSGVIDAGDYTVWKSNFGNHFGSGSGAGASAAVPEPATLVMLLSGILMMCCRRARRCRKRINA